MRNRQMRSCPSQLAEFAQHYRTGPPIAPFSFGPLGRGGGEGIEIETPSRGRMIVALGAVWHYPNCPS
jgi:hypothetical protein